MEVWMAVYIEVRRQASRAPEPSASAWSNGYRGESYGVEA